MLGASPSRTPVLSEPKNAVLGWFIVDLADLAHVVRDVLSWASMAGLPGLHGAVASTA